MSESPSPTIRTPGDRRLAYIGGATAACALAWLATIGIAPTSAAGHLPLEAFMTILAVAIATSVTALVLGVAYINLKASTENHAAIVIAVGQLAAEMEQNSAKLDQIADKVNRIDPWTIYTAVYEDLLKDRRN